MITIKQINISTERGTAKFPVDSAEITETGIKGDAHSGDWHRQITILAEESVIKFEKETGRKTKSGEFATNIMISGLDTSKVKVGDRFLLNTAEVEVTQIGKEPHFYDSPVLKETGRNIMFDEGLFAKVLKPGNIKIGDKVEYIKKPLKLRIITLSDSASKGIYADKSGPKIKERLLTHFSEIKTDISINVIPDEKNQLEELLMKYVDENADVIFTTGGTGIGPRDITPEVVTEFADKLIPGIMDHIRIKYGATIPNALLSRSVAAVKDNTLIYTLPGSVKAVNEYMDEILKTIDHLFKMLAGEGH
ncbi:MAG: molybdenum cofactor synthesis protein [Candidatus Delongbacteria bacterium]|nr:molybdenum cofactor synthesis protein [Candidatus Delongbacteria bacterium]